MIRAETRSALVVRVDQVVPDPRQPRRRITPESVSELVLSVRTHGVISPVLLSRHPDAAAHPDTPFMLIVGERRWRAARGAGLRHIPAVLCDAPLSPAARLMLQLEENEGDLRRELTLAERVDAVSRAYQISGMRKEEFATAHGKTGGWISHYLALAGADPETRTALAEGHLTGINTARLYLRLEPPDRIELLERARRTLLPITDKLIEATAQERLRQSRPTAASLALATAITLVLSLHQLEALLRRLGESPRATPDEQLHQLRSLLP
jgi:ParB family chromosome partitioning protein